MEIPFSQACENNKFPILEVLRNYQLAGDILEIGHGTGQHALFFAENLPVRWFASDVKSNHWMLSTRPSLPQNITHSIELEVGKAPLEKQIKQQFDHIYTANTLHIMSEVNVQNLCQNMHALLKPGGNIFIYGPFKFNNQFTSDSNQNFDYILRENNQESGIRDFEMLKKELRHLFFQEKIDLPANNHLLVFKK